VTVRVELAEGVERDKVAIPSLMFPAFCSEAHLAAKALARSTISAKQSYRSAISSHPSLAA
jgi:hypothetical protein